MRLSGIIGLFLAIIVIFIVANERNAAGIIDWFDDSTIVAQREGGNFIGGDGIDVAGVDAPSDDRVNFTLAADLVTAGSDGDSSTVESDSGLEFVSFELTLLRGCADNEIFKWDETEDDWNCEADTGGGGHVIQDEGSSLTARTNLNFTGGGITCTDDAGNDQTDCDVPTGGGATITVQKEDVTVDAAVSVLDFQSGFSITSSPAGEANVALASGEPDFLASGALTCGAATQGQILVHTTPLQYCDNAATPVLQFSAYGNSTGESTAAANNSVTLATDTTGDYVATIADAGNSTITVVGSGSENAAVTLDAVGLNCTDCLGPTEITDSYLLNSGDSSTGDLDFNDGVGNSPQVNFTPQTGTAWDLYVEDAGNDFQIETNTASTETLDITNAGSGVVDVNIEGDLTISGDDLTMATNTSGFLLIADSTNFNPTAMSGDSTITSGGTVSVVNTTCTGTQDYLDGTGACDTLNALSDFTNDAVYDTVQDEGSGLTQRRIINFIGAGVSCVDDATDSTDCTIAGGAGGEDLQGTYDLETTPALITETDALGGIIFEGDAETSDPNLTLRDSTSGKVGLLIDNDDEAANEPSPILRIANSTSGAGDTQFDFVVTTSDELEIQDDGGSPLLRLFTSLVTILQDLVINSNVLTFGLGTASNPVLTFDTDESTDATITFDAVTDNRFEINKAVDATVLTEGGNAVANSTEEFILDADVIATCDSTSDNLIDSTCVEQDAGTDISTDLEEEDHNTEHASGGDDILFVERHAVWQQTGDVSTTMVIENIRLYADNSGTIKDVRCSVNTAPTTSAVTVDVNLNGTTIFTTQSGRPSIAAAGNTDVSSTPDVTSYSSGDFFDIDVDAEDSGDTAADITCQMRTREAVFSSS